MLYPRVPSGKVILDKSPIGFLVPQWGVLVTSVDSFRTRFMRYFYYNNSNSRVNL